MVSNQNVKIRNYVELKIHVTRSFDCKDLFANGICTRVAQVTKIPAQVYDVSRNTACGKEYVLEPRTCRYADVDSVQPLQIRIRHRGTPFRTSTSEFAQLALVTERLIQDRSPFSEV